jgi:hypothetical protein
MRLAPALHVIPWLVVPCLLACATAPPPADPVAALRARAASDLSCPGHLLRIAPMGAETFGASRVPLYQDVEGCSMHVIYVATESGYVLSAPQMKPPKGPDHVDVR